MSIGNSVGVAMNKCGTWTSAHTTVTTSSGSVVSANTARRCLIIQNIGSKDCYLEIGGTAVKEQDLLLAKGGGSVVFDAGALTLAAIECVTKVGTTIVVAMEGTP